MHDKVPFPIVMTCQLTRYPEGVSNRISCRYRRPSPAPVVFRILTKTRLLIKLTDSHDTPQIPQIPPDRLLPTKMDTQTGSNRPNCLITMTYAEMKSK